MILSLRNCKAADCAELADFPLGLYRTLCGFKNMLTEEQSVALEQLLLFADIRQAEVIRQILAEFSSQTYRQKYAKE